MTIYWVDPYIHNGAGYRGNGTTDTTSRSGTYAAPWSMEDMNTASSKSIDANSEVKIKGLSKTDLFVNLGKFYANSSYYYSMDLVPATGNTNWAANRGSSKYNVGGFAFVIDLTESGVPDVSPQQKASDFPFLPTFPYYTSGTSSIEIRYTNSTGFWIATRLAGYNSASNPFPADIWGIRTGFNLASWSNGDHYNLFDNDNIDTVSAGWVSDTESTPSGYSLFFSNQSDTNENKYLKGGTNTQFNCSRFHVFNYNREYWNFYPQKGNTTHYFGGGTERGYNSNRMRVTNQWNNDQKDIVLHCMGSEGLYYIRHNNDITVHTSLNAPQLNLVAPSQSGITDSNIGRFRIGSLYTAYNDIAHSLFYATSLGSTTASGAIEYLNGSTYFSTGTTQSLMPTNSAGTTAKANMGDFRTFYPSTMYKAGISGGWMASASSSYAPLSGGGSFYENDQMYSADIDLYKTNWFEVTSYSNNRVAGDYMPVKVMGVLKCGGTNPRGATNSITFAHTNTHNTGYYYPLICFETNDYDQKPITLVPSTGGASCYAYNETISSENVLHLQGSNSSSTLHYYPLELAVPSHTAGTDNLRIKLRLSRSNYTYATTVSHYYRKDDNAGGIQATTSTLTTSGISTDSASPSTHTINFTLSANGTREINALYAAIRFASTSTSAILRIHSAEVETY